MSVSNGRQWSPEHEVRTNGRQWSPEHEVRIRAAELAWDLAIQIAALRRAHGLSQADLATRIGTAQPAISRLERPSYDRHSLRLLREVGQALDAFVDVVYVPRNKLETYLQHRYLPVLDEPPAAPRPELRLEEAKRFRLRLHPDHPVTPQIRVKPVASSL